MKLNVVLYPLERWGSVDEMVVAAKRADQLGFGSIGLSEHIVNPIESPTARRAVTSDLWYDNFVVGGFLAAETTRIGITLSALVVPYRNPILAAKAIATLDTMSRGRLTVIVGAGEGREIGVFDNRIVGVSPQNPVVEHRHDEHGPVRQPPQAGGLSMPTHHLALRAVRIDGEDPGSVEVGYVP